MTLTLNWETFWWVIAVDITILGIVYLLYGAYQNYRRRKFFYTPDDYKQKLKPPYNPRFTLDDEPNNE